MSNDLLQEIAYKYKCDYCYYTTSNKYDYNKHLTTQKHKSSINNATFSIEINSNNSTKVANYDCSICNYYSKNKSNYDKHLLTDKHINNCILANEGEPTETKHICSPCNKEYSKYNSLWRHKKICIVIDKQREPTELQNVFTPNNGISQPSFSATDLFLEVLKESKELQHVLIEQNKDLQNKLLEQNNKLLEQNNKLLEKDNILHRPERKMRQTHS